MPIQNGATALPRFVGINLGRERVPDGTKLLKFRRLLEKHELGAALFARVGQMLQDQGMKVGAGTIVDATIISAPPSTKNAAGERDPGVCGAGLGQHLPRPWANGGLSAPAAGEQPAGQPERAPKSRDLGRLDR